jgi:ribonuclease P protein component
LPGDAATVTQAFRFSRLNRLLLPADFQRVFQRALRSADRYFTVLWQQSSGPSPRIGFAIAKKRIPGAVARNRLRRLAHESFRQHSHELGVVDIVMLAQTAAGQASNKELFRSLEQHWRKIAAVSNHPQATTTTNKEIRGTSLDG